MAVEFVNRKPIARSTYVLVLRKGIRYTDDIWISSKNMKPITSTKQKDITSARFIFQSKKIMGSSTDIFVADFDGKNMYNLTGGDEPFYNGLFDDNGEEVAQWIEEFYVKFSSLMFRSRRINRIEIDPYIKEQVNYLSRDDIDV